MKRIPKVNIGFEFTKSSGVEYCFSKQLSKVALHGATLRFGGVSEGALSSLNLGWNRPESKDNIRENYRRLARAAGFEYESMVLTNYCHGDNIVKVTKSDAGRGFDKEPLEFCDGLVTIESGITLVTLFADCNPLFFCEPKAGIKGVCHAGWKGTSLRVGGKMIKEIVKLGGKAENVIAAIGPSICQNCFEVDDDVRGIFEKNFAGYDIIKGVRGAKSQIDLWQATSIALVELGVQEENITLCAQCTFEHEDKYFSHRRDTKLLGTTGAMAAFVIA